VVSAEDPFANTSHQPLAYGVCFTGGKDTASSHHGVMIMSSSSLFHKGRDASIEKGLLQVIEDLAWTERETGAVIMLMPESLLLFTTAAAASRLHGGLEESNPPYLSMMTGHEERAVGLIQCLLELNLQSPFPPPTQPMKSLASFWESDFPRIGDADPSTTAVGWSDWYRQQKVGDKIQ